MGALDRISRTIDALFSGLGTARRSGVEAVKRAKADYDAETRYAKMRIWIVGALVADVVGTLLFVLLASDAPPAIEAWYQPGFPANMVVIRNQSGAAIREVELLIDDRYRAKMDRLIPGPNGLRFNTDFKDRDDRVPPSGYAPKTLEIRARDEVLRLSLPNRQ